MNKDLGLYLFLSDGASDWVARPCRDLSDLGLAWSRASSAGAALGIIHVGYGPPECSELDVASLEKHGKLFATTSAKWVLCPAIEVSEQAVAPVGLTLSRHGQELFPVATEISKLANQVSEPAESDSAEAGWIAKVQKEHPELSRELELRAITSEHEYVQQASLLPDKTRDRLDDLRFRFLLPTVSQEDHESILRILPNWLLDLPTSELPLSVRIAKAVVHFKIKTVRDLAKVSADQFLGLANFGRTSLRTLAGLLAKEATRGPKDLARLGTRSRTTCLSEQLARTLSRLPVRTRKILEGRLGFCGPTKTLELLATECGISRERVRQIVNRTVEEIVQAEYWDDILVQKLGSLLTNRRAPIYLDELPALDPWFAGFDSPRVLASLIEVFGSDHVTILSIQGMDVVARVTQTRWNELVDSLLDSMEAFVERRMTRSQVEAWLKNELTQYRIPELLSLVKAEIDPFLHFASKEGSSAEVLIQVGRGLAPVIRAVLEEAPEPLHYSEVASRVAARRGVDPSDSFIHSVHNRMPDAGATPYGKGTFGLPGHCELPEADQTVVRDEAERLLIEGEQGRRWTCAELLPLLLEYRPDLTGLLTAFTVNMLLDQSKRVEKVGRLTWRAKQAIRSGSASQTSTATGR